MAVGIILGAPPVRFHGRSNIANSKAYPNT
jgi:hypothetical protein